MRHRGRGGQISTPKLPQDGRGVSRAKSGNQEVEYHAQNREIKSVNGDGVVSVADVMTVLKAVTNDETVDNADMNNDGRLDLVDVLRILRKAIE